MRWVWTWSRSCGRFARSRHRSQDGARGLRPLGAPRAVLANYLISNLGLQLARLRDQLLDRFFRRQHADELPLDVDVPHVLRKARWIAQGQLANRGDAGGAHEPD